MLTRREVLRSGVAAGLAALVPAWLVTPIRRKRIDLTKFCDLSGHGMKWAMQKPFQQADWTFATDGHVCVRVEPKAGDVLGGEIPPPPALGLRFWDHDSLRGWKPLRGEPVTALGPCPDCDSNGIIGKNSECQECEGMGMLLDAAGRLPAHRCKPCRGTGRIGGVRCPRCMNSRGTISRWVAWESMQRVNGVYLGTEYYRKLESLGGVEIAVAKEDEPVRFRFDGGVGLLCTIDRAAAEGQIAEARR